MNSPSQWFAVSLAFVWLSTDAPGGHSAEPFAVSIQVDAASDLGELKPIWRFFGADEPNYAYMPNGSKLISHLGQLSPKQVYLPCSQSIVHGRRDARFEMGLHQRVYRRLAGESGL